MKFRIRIQSRWHGLYGKVDYTSTDTLTERDGGVQVETVACGVCDGDHFDQKFSKFCPDVSLAEAANYRRANGYTEV